MQESGREQDSGKDPGSGKSRGSGGSQGAGKAHGSFESSLGDVTNSQVVVGDGNVVAQKGAAAAGPGGSAAAGHGAAATGGAAAAAGHSSANVGLIERAKKSRAFKIAGIIAVLATLAATGLLIAGVTDLGVAGYIVAVISVIVAVIPLFSNK
jgi:hypothetical protein